MPLLKAATHPIPQLAEVLPDAGAGPAVHANRSRVASMSPSPVEAARCSWKTGNYRVKATLAGRALQVA